MSSEDNPPVDKSHEENQLVICELIYRLRKELAFSTGANNMIRTLSEQKKFDQESTRRAFETRTQAEEKIDLIRLALKKYSLIGCGELVSKVDGRDSCWNCYDSISSSASKGKRKTRSLNWSTSPKSRRQLTCRFPPTVCSVVPPRSPVSSLSTYQNASFSTHPEVFALVKIDSHVVANTKPKPMSSYCWDERFDFELEQNRELEIEIYYRDARSMCAFCVFRLDELTTGSDMPLKTSFEIEPQGVLYVDAMWNGLVRTPASMNFSSRNFSVLPLKSARRMSRSTTKEAGRHLPFVNFFRNRANNNPIAVDGVARGIASAQTCPPRKISLFERLTSNVA